MHSSTQLQNPALLFIGDKQTITQKIFTHLQKEWCDTACGSCISCVHIHEKKSAHITWISPEKNYTLEHLQPIFDTMRFALDTDKKHFFILEKADFLSVTCANSLLKPIEEPAPGYHFILLAEYADRVLPTIISRCTLHTYAFQTPPQLPNFLRYFTNTQDMMMDTKQFLSELEALNPHEHTTLQWLSLLTNFLSDSLFVTDEK